MTRDEHMNWCKERALEYVENGDLPSAITSMLSDLGKHEETRGVGETMAPLGLFEATGGSADSVRRFIEGFN